MRKVVHFEIPAEDMARASAFYTSVFDWHLATVPLPAGEYTTVTTTPVDSETQMPTEPGSINGGLMPRTEQTPAPVITVDVDAIDDTLREVEAAGGTIVTPRTAIPGMGAFAYLRDTEGNVLGLWEMTG